jgi:hypothetical protein
MRRLAAIIPLALFLSGCATEAERYQWNVTHMFVCPRARWLTHSDLDQIARAVAHATPQVAAAVTTPANDISRRVVLVDTLYRGTEESQDRYSYGWCELQKSGDDWRVVKVYTDTSPSLWYASRCP